MLVEEITTFEKFLTLKADWSRLAGNCSFFSTFDWNRIWWECLGSGKKLNVLVAKNEGMVVGIAPLMTIGSRVRFIGTPLADYGDFIVAEDKREVLDAFLRHMLNDREWKTIQLDEIQESSSTIPIMRKLLEKYDNKHLVSESIGCLALDFSKSSDDALAKLLKKKDLRRHVKYFEANLLFAY